MSLIKIILPFLLLFSFPTIAHANETQVECLARNAYFEAGGEGQRGIVAVTNVVLNRTKDKRFGSTPCAVVHQRSGRTCQFSWTCRRQPIRDMSLYRRCREIVASVYYNRSADITNGALFYHAAYISGSWFKRSLRQTARIGSHIFYR